MRHMILIASATVFIAATTAAKAERLTGPFVLAQAASEKAVGEAEGVVKAVDATERRLQITHGPITGSLQMPGMTMVFRVAPSVDISGLSKGAKIKFTVTRDEKGLYLIEQLKRED